MLALQVMFMVLGIICLFIAGTARALTLRLEWYGFAFFGLAFLMPMIHALMVGH